MDALEKIQKNGFSHREYSGKVIEHYFVKHSLKPRQDVQVWVIEKKTPEIEIRVNNKKVVDEKLEALFIEFVTELGYEEMIII